MALRRNLTFLRSQFFLTHPVYFYSDIQTEIFRLARETSCLGTIENINIRHWLCSALICSAWLLMCKAITVIYHSNRQQQAAQAGTLRCVHSSSSWGCYYHYYHRPQLPPVPRYCSAPSVLGEKFQLFISIIFLSCSMGGHYTGWGWGEIIIEQIINTASDQYKHSNTFHLQH